MNNARLFSVRMKTSISLSDLMPRSLLIKGLQCLGQVLEKVCFLYIFALSFHA